MEADRARIWSQWLYAAALTTLLFSLPSCGAGGFVGFALAFTLMLAFLMAGILVRLFGVTQIRLIELITLVVILGNALGLSLHFIRESAYFEPGHRLLLQGVVSGGIGVWILGGVSSGLQLAAALKRERQSQRFWLMFIGLLIPLVALCLIGSFVGLLAGLANPKFNGLILFASIIVLGISLLFTFYVGALRDEARRIRET